MMPPLDRTITYSTTIIISTFTDPQDPIHEMRWEVVKVKTLLLPQPPPKIQLVY